MSLSDSGLARTLDPSEKLALLGLARGSVLLTLEGQLPEPLALSRYPERLRAPGASFVTLLRSGCLRGCLGSLQAERPLAEDVRQHSIAVCTADYRFPPVTRQEIPELTLEISVLRATREVEYSTPQELVVRLRPGVDGVLIRAGPRRATFLPKVWERVPEAEKFLTLLCRKAGLDEDAWRRDRLQISTYEVESFQE